MPLTPDDVAHLPPQPLDEGVNPVGELGAHVAVLSRRKEQPADVEISTDSQNISIPHEGKSQ